MKTNKIREYIMLKNKFNHVKLEEVGCYDWCGDLKYTDEVYKMLNYIFKMDSLITETSYVVAFDHAKKPKGVCKIGQGDASETPTSMQNIFTFLLLAGANAFILVHNHTTELPKASLSDKMITFKTDNLAQMFGMEFTGHMIINPNGYIIDGGVMDGTNRVMDEYGDLFDCDDDEDEEDDDVFEEFQNKAATTQITSENMAEFVRMLRKQAEGKGGY